MPDRYDVQFLTINRHRRAFVKVGEGPALLLLHGLGCDHTTWDAVIEPLSRRYTVIAPDLLGHGRSDKPRADYSIGAYANAMRDLLSVLDVERVTVLGHSLGGAISMQMAHDHPQKVKSMTLICSAGLGHEFGSYVDDYVAASNRKELKPVLERLFADKSLVSRQLVDDVLKYKRLDGVDTVLGGLAEAIFGGQKQHALPGASLPSGHAPALVIWGKEDQVIPSAHANNLKGAKVHVLEGAGHMVFMEKASDVNALIKAHIAGH